MNKTVFRDCLYTIFMMVDCSGGMVIISIRARLVRLYREREDYYRMLMYVYVF